MVENGMPVSERVLMDGTPVPATHARDGRNEVGPDCSFDFHELRIPTVFLGVSEAFVFFGAFALGLRTSLFERFCPLAIWPSPDCPAPVRRSMQFCGARIEACFHAIKQTGSGVPCLCAAFERRTHMSVDCRRRAFAIGCSKSAASLSRILGLSPGRAHLAFRFAAASASRALE